MCTFYRGSSFFFFLGVGRGGGGGGGGGGHFSFFHFLFFKYLIFHKGKFGSLYPGKSQQPQEQCYLFLSVCAIFSCVQTMVWLPVFWIFNVRTDVDA